MVDNRLQERCALDSLHLELDRKPSKDFVRGSCSLTFEEVTLPTEVLLNSWVV